MGRGERQEPSEERIGNTVERGDTASAGRNPTRRAGAICAVGSSKGLTVVPLRSAPFSCPRRKWPPAQRVNLIPTCSWLSAGVMACLISLPAIAAPPPKVVNANDGILAAFQSHPLVGLSEWHGLAQEMDFYAVLVRDPRFAKEVGNIVLETGDAAEQEANTVTRALFPNSGQNKSICSMAGARGLRPGARRAMARPSRRSR
ncbi:MAG: hypothetical protein WCA81_00315, partial [Rhizomicrobium sp.]